MDIDRVRYFHIFSVVGSLVKASEILHISQPALSKALRLLEVEVGAKLLESEGRGLRLTTAGIAFKKQTAGLLLEWLAVPERIKGLMAATPKRIGSFEVFTTYFLGSLLEQLEIDALEVHEYLPGALESAIAGGEIDLGITYLPIPKENVEFTEVTKIRMGVFGVSGLSDTAFSSLPFVVPLAPAGGTPSKVMGLDGWPDHRIPRQIKFRVTLMESALEICRRGLAVAFLPEFIVELQNRNVRSKFQLHRLQSPLAQRDCLQSVYLVKPQRSQETALDRKIARCLRELK